jgi:hypothetical protein
MEVKSLSRFARAVSKSAMQNGRMPVKPYFIPAIVAFFIINNGQCLRHREARLVPQSAHRYRGRTAALPFGLMSL